MKEHPIIFSTPMIRTILADHKTQTRRVIKPRCRNVWGYYPAANFWVGPHPGGGFWAIDNPGGPPAWIIEDQKARNSQGFLCPYGIPGDLLWVRETWADHFILGAFREKRIIYKADRPDRPVDNWISPLFLPKEYARLWLEVINVRVERVQEITEEDALTEGCKKWIEGKQETDSARNDFIQLWDALNAKRGYEWDQNPWVWVIEFKRIEMGRN